MIFCLHARAPSAMKKLLFQRPPSHVPTVAIVCWWIQLAAGACVTLWTLPAGCISSLFLALTLPLSLSVCVCVYDASINRLLFWKLYYFIISIQMSVHQRSPAGSVPVLFAAGNVARCSPAPRVAPLSGFHYTGLCWEAPATGDIKAFITDMRRAGGKVWAVMWLYLVWSQKYESARRALSMCAAWITMYNSW